MSRMPRTRVHRGDGSHMPDCARSLLVETHALKDSIETGKVPADELLDRYNGDWNGDLTRIYADYSY